MKNFKNAFTMVELIFVIVILGILAAVAIPKLAATRTDAEVSKTAQNIMVATFEIASYAVAKGFTDTNLSVMSNAISSLDAVLTNSKATIAFGGVADCTVIEVVSGANDENLTISFGNANGDSKCLALQSVIDAKKYPIKLRGQSVK